MPLPIFKGNTPIPKQKQIRRIAVAAGKGGVGKSTVAVNLARSLKLLGFKVGILDADVYGPSVRKMLPEDTMPVQQGEKIIPANSEGIAFISMAHFRKEHDAVVARAPIANGIISQFLHDVIWGDLDYLLIDFPPGTGDIQLTLAQKAQLNGAVLVTTPQEVATLDVKKALEMFRHLQVPLLGVIENLSGYYHQDSDTTLYLFGNGGGERLAREAGIPLLGKLPIDPELCLRSDQGISPFLHRKGSDCPSAAVFTEVAQKIHEDLQNRSLTSPIEIHKIFQKDRTTFIIEWQDGKVSEYDLRDLQRNCPCAACVNKEINVDANLSAKGVQRVGTYGLQIAFTTGCSKGIYSFEFLKQLSSRI